MADEESQIIQEQIPRQFELDQTEDYSQYLLHSKSEILAVLRSLIQKSAMITAYFDRGNSFLLTSVIALGPDNRTIILDIGSDEEMNRRALAADKLIFTTLVDKVKVQFSLAEISQSKFEGRAAFVGLLPEKLLRLQRREYFRLSTPIANPIRLSVTHKRSDGSAVAMDIPLLDISGGGVGLMVVPEHAKLFQRGDMLPDCRMTLPNEGLLVVTLSVRNRFEVTTRTGSHFTRIGCEFVNLSSARLSMVQRYITHIERERKARLSGLA